MLNEWTEIAVPLLLLFLQSTDIVSCDQKHRLARQVPMFPVLPNGAPCSANLQCASGCCVCSPQEWYDQGACSIGMCVATTLRGQICGLLRAESDYGSGYNFGGFGNSNGGWGRTTFLTQGGVINGYYGISPGRRRKRLF